jgi:NOL1/NOP2/fmu family ribosome biogenesis protein
MQTAFVPLPAKQLPALEAFSLPAEEVYADRRNQDIYYFQPQMMEHLPLLMKALYVKKAGVKLGQLLRDELIPDHALAMSGLVNDEGLKIELDKAAALDYLRSHPLEVGSFKPGWRLVSYDGVDLGWVKVLKGRVNNYYPKSWRILNK